MFVVWLQNPWGLGHRTVRISKLACRHIKWGSFWSSESAMFDFIGLGRGLESFCRSTRPRPRLRPFAKPRIVSRSIKHPTASTRIEFQITFQPSTFHMFLRQNLSTKSNDGGKGGHFCNCNDISNDLQWTRGALVVGQLSLNLDNDLSILSCKFTKGIIALPVAPVVWMIAHDFC